MLGHRAWAARVSSKTNTSKIHSDLVTRVDKICGLRLFFLAERVNPVTSRLLLKNQDLQNAIRSGKHEHSLVLHYQAQCKWTQHCWPTIPNIVGCYWHVASVNTPCYMLLRVVKSLKPVKLLTQQLPIFLLCRDRRSVAQRCWIRLNSSSNIVRV